MRALKAFFLGAAAFGLIAYVAAGAIAVAAQAGAWRNLRLAVGPLLLVAVERSGEATATTFGPGLLAVAVAGGLANALAAAVLARYSR